MNPSRFLLTIAAVLPLALAQNRLPPVPPAAPGARIPPVPPEPRSFVWIDDQIRVEVEAVREQAEAIREQAQQAAQDAREMALAAIPGGVFGGIPGGFAFAPQPPPRPFDR